LADVVVVVAVHEFEGWAGASADTDKQCAPLVRQADVDNHNVEGGLWVVSDGCVYDIDHLKPQFSPHQLERCIRKLYSTTPRLLSNKLVMVF